MTFQEKILKLYYLYHLELFGERFCDDFPQSATEKKQGVLGHSPKGAKIGFISQTPLLDHDSSFLPKKSAQMLEDIITKVFNLSPKECCILSLFKTSQISYDEHIKQHADILLSQISQSSARVFMIFGASEIADHLFSKNTELGTPIKFKHKTLIPTHSFGALIKLPALKKQTFQHLTIAKAFI